MLFRKIIMLLGCFSLLLLTEGNCGESKSRAVIPIGSSSNPVSVGIPAGNYKTKLTGISCAPPIDSSIVLTDGRQFITPANTTTGSSSLKFEYVEDNGSNTWIYKITEQKAGANVTPVFIRCQLQADGSIRKFGGGKSQRQLAHVKDKLITDPCFVKA